MTENSGGSAISTGSNKPVIFLAFANDRDDTVGYLRNLPDEARRVREVLEPAEQAGLCEVVLRTNSTASDIFKVFQDPKYRNRIAIFHYGGHANGYQLLLESAEGQATAADAGGLARFLGQQQGLKLVFLNGCSTQQQTDGLLDANIPAVISTSRAIDDQVATDFSNRFYQGLAGGASVRTAYNEAEAAVQTSKAGNPRGGYFGKHDGSKMQPVADRWPWNLSLRAGSENADQWNLPEAVDDPLFGLPPLPEQDLPQSPYRYLNWFTQRDAEVFFGRGHQIRELYDRLTAPRTAPIMLFYGQSGVGKSSILDAGLIPRLQQDYEVRYVRRTAHGLLESLRSVLLPEMSEVSIENAWRTKEESLGKPLILLVDQVEELFTRPAADLSDELDQLLKVVKATFVESDQRPRGKLVLGFRKEWLAELEARLVDYELPRTRVFLEPLDRRGIIEVVQGPTRTAQMREHYGLTVDDGLAEIIAEDLLADRDSAIAPTLQILLTKLWAKATETNYEHPCFSQDLYQHLRRDGILLRDFLNQQVASFRERNPEAVDSGLLLDIVTLHTTPLGTADQCTLERLQQQYSHLDAALPDLLQQCQDLHLLTVSASAEKESTKTTRLAHDTLAPLVREQFDESDKPGQRARRILDNRRVDWEEGSQGTPLDETDLTIVEQGATGTRALSETEQRLLEASLLERAKRIRVQRTLRIIGVVSAIVISALAVWALISRNDAVVARAAAEQNQQKAEESFQQARSAVKSFFKTVSEETLLKEPGMQGLRNQLLQQALEYDQQFLEQRPDDPELQDELAESSFRIGLITRIIGSPEQALEWFKKAVYGQEAKYESDPQDMKNISALSKTWTETGRTYYQVSNLAASSDAFAEAVKYRRKLVEMNPDDAESVRLLANALMNRGTIADQNGELSLAEGLMNEAQQLRRKHQDSGPSMLRDLATGHYQLARLYERQMAMLSADEKWDEADVSLNSAEGQIEKAITLFQQLVSTEKDYRNELSLANAYRLSGDLCLENESRLKWYQEAEKLLMALTNENPLVSKYGLNLEGVRILIQDLQQAGSSDTPDG